MHLMDPTWFGINHYCKISLILIRYSVEIHCLVDIELEVWDAHERNIDDMQIVYSHDAEFSPAHITSDNWWIYLRKIKPLYSSRVPHCSLYVFIYEVIVHDVWAFIHIFVWNKLPSNRYYSRNIILYYDNIKLSHQLKMLIFSL